MHHRFFTPSAKIVAPHRPVRSAMGSVLEIAANPHKKKEPWRPSDIRKEFAAKTAIKEYFDSKRLASRLEEQSKKKAAQVKFAVARRTPTGFYVVGLGEDGKGDVKNAVGEVITKFNDLKTELARRGYTKLRYQKMNSIGLVAA